MRERLKILQLLTWYKKLKEEQAQAKVFNARKEINMLEEKKEEVLQEKSQLYEKLKNSGLLTAEEFKVFLAEIENINKYKEFLDKEIEKKQKELGILSEELIKAYKERKLMESLKEKTKAAWLFEQTKKFYKEIDDLAILRAAKKNEQI